MRIELIFKTGLIKKKIVEFDTFGYVFNEKFLMLTHKNLDLEYYNLSELRSFKVLYAEHFDKYKKPNKEEAGAVP